MVVMSPDIREKIGRHAVREFPRECCGILVGEKRRSDVVVRRVVEALNVVRAEEAATRYEVEPLAIVRADRAAMKEGMEIVGFYHSHPNHPAAASATDARMAWEACLYVIAAVTDAEVGDLRAWALEGGNMAEVRIVTEREEGLGGLTNAPDQVVTRSQPPST
jgi:proteasome lid subunit RPN8/RPN11